MKILMATAACTRQAMQTDETYDTIDRWIAMCRSVGLVDDYYLFLNDIPEPRRSELFRMCDAAGVKYDYADLGYCPDNRSHKSREPFEDGPPDKHGNPTTIPIRGQEYLRFAVTRNAVIDYALRDGCDYIFNVDSDVICRPFTVERLLPRMAPDIGMFACLVNNLARFISRSRVTIFKVPEAQYKFNVCDYVENKGNKVKPGYIRHTNIRYNKIQQVDISGACCLLAMKPFRDLGLRYEANPNGEDCDICLKLRKVGYKTMVDTAADLEALHLQELWLYRNQPLIDSYLSGENPDYFRFKAEP